MFSTMSDLNLKRALVLSLQCLIITGLPYNPEDESMYLNDYETSNDTEEPGPIKSPKFISDSLSMLVNEGETVRLPCVVDRLQGFVLLWKQKGEFVAVAEQIVNKRFKIEHNKNGNNLVLEKVSPADEGEYVCQISAYDPKYLTHTISVRVEPEIETTPGELLVVREGDPASLSCKVLRGSPAPSVTWTRKHKPEVIEGSEVKWNAVTRHDGGQYICLADNGFGPEPVSKEVKLEVHYVPHVEIDEPFVHTAEGEEAKIACTVHCSPRCEISWSKDGGPVDQTNQNLYVNTLGAVHTLSILKVSSEYLGEYECTGKNQLGSNSAKVKVSGLAYPAVFQDNTVSPWLDKFFLEWSVVSKSVVESFSVEYRGEGDLGWSRREVKAVAKTEQEWQGSITLEGLSPATRYEAKVSARNQFGYNNYSKPFFFATKGAEPMQQPSVSSSSSTAFNNISLILAVLAVRWRALF